MIRIVIVEKEAIAKDVIFEFEKILQDEFTFKYYSKIIDFAKDKRISTYDIIIMDESYNNVRVNNALNLKKNSAIVMYTTFEDKDFIANSYGRIFYINKNSIEEDFKKIKEEFNQRLLKHTEYIFSYNGVVVKLKYQQIHYIEKDGKNVVFHTTKGEFYKRGSIAKLSEEFMDYDFVRINSGIIVNYEFIFKIEEDEVELNSHERLPLSRSRKPKLYEYVRQKTKNSK